MLLKRIYKNTILLLLLLIPLVCYDGMKWGFHTPRYLILQLFVFLFLCIHFFKSKTVLRFSCLDLSIMIWLFFIVIHSFLLHGGGDLFNRIDMLLYFGLFYFSIQFVEGDQKSRQQHNFRERAFLILAVTALLLSIYGLLQFFRIDPFRSGLYPAAESKVIATMGNANSLAGYLATVFPFVIYYIVFSKKRFNTAFWQLSTIVVFITIILTLSRGAWLGLIGGLLILLFPKVKTIWQGKLRKFFLISSITISMLFFSWVSYKINPDSAIGRIFIWKISAKMIADHPVTGMGYGRYGVEFLNYQAQFFDEPENAKYFDRADNLKGAKNEYFQIIAETGIVGFSLFLLIIVLFYYFGYKVVKSSKNNTKEYWSIMAVMASQSVILIHALVDNPFYDVATTIVFWFNLGMISLKAKEMNLSTIKTNKLHLHLPEFQISFSHNSALRLFILAFLIYNIYQIVNKAKAYNHWQNAQNLVACGNWNQCIEQYEKVLKVFPDDGELQFHLGSAYSYTKQPEKALPLLKSSQQKFNDKNIYIVQGYTLIQMGDYLAAENSFRTALRMYPKLLLPRLWLAELYRQQRRLEDAKSELNQILEIQSKIITDEIRKIKLEARKKLNKFNSMNQIR
ncbi:MAG: O-antigen ligase family protein [Methanosarcinaceae archaeon]